MNLLRKLLFPLALMYSLITIVRNFLYDKNILKSYSFELPVVVVGNLSVGGTGKTPLVEYLIRLLASRYKVATLSRGYKRKTKGYLLADESSNAEKIGDEPFQYFQKFPNIQVAVDANRKNGIERLLNQKEIPEVILLDDAYQHRRVKAGLYILLTTYDDLYYNDYVLPTGSLRENRSGANRANIIIVTKCPNQLSISEQESIKQKIGLQHTVFFSTITYENQIYGNNKSLNIKEIKNSPKLLLAGIAKPETFFAYLQNPDDGVMTFSDHHHFSKLELEKIKKKANNHLIITTEKDYVRLKDSILKDQLYYLPIQSQFLSEGENFNKTILDYVGTSTRNRSIHPTKN